MANQNLTDAANDLFKAIDLLTAKQINQLEFDKTIVCTITGNGNAKKGIYTVTDDSTEFIAYSEDTTYRVGAKVYVKIPNGDMANQKIITGKYVANDADYITYVAPLNAFIDITGNLIEEDHIKSLRANSPITNTLIWEYIPNATEADKSRLEALIANTQADFEKRRVEVLNDPSLTQEEKNKKIAEIAQSCEDVIEYYEAKLEILDKKTFKGYERLGLKADFKSLLPDGIHKGNFGLKLDITELTKTGLTKIHNYVLDSSDMYGDSYKYTNFYSQEILFDISHIHEITALKLFFYQSDNFTLPGNERMPMNELYDDLFVQYPYISLGYATETFTRDEVLLESYDPVTYNSENKEPQRRINMRWIHKIGDKYYSIDEKEEIPKNAVVHWYRHQIAQGIKDELAGHFWEEFYPEENIFSFKFIPDYTKDYDSFKVIIECPSRQAISDILETHAEINNILRDMKINSVMISEIKKLCTMTNMDDVSAHYEVLRNTFRDSAEQLARLGDIYSIVLDERAKTQYYESEVFKFENEISQADELFDLIQSFTLEVDKEGHQGIYRLYDTNNSLINVVEASRLRTIKALYTSVITAENELNSAEEITWYIPVENTMIAPPVDGKEYSLDNGDLYFPVEESERPGYVMIRRFGTDTNDELESGIKLIESVQTFRIKDYYDQSAVNNTIYCKVKKRGREYGSLETLYFGPAGHTNAKANFKLNLYSVHENQPVDKVPAITMGGKAIIVPELYNYNNILIDISEYPITYSWMTNTFITYEPLPDSKNVILNAENATVNNSGFSILKAVIEFNNIGITPEIAAGEKTYLTAYLPIAIRSSNDYSVLEGPTQVLYNERGVDPEYYKEPFKVRNSLGLNMNLQWFGCSEDMLEAESKGNSSQLTKLRKFYPKVGTDGSFIPQNMYYANLYVYSAFAVGDDYRVSDGYANSIAKSVWAQPILILQVKNRLPSILQDWNGDLTIDENNGIILSTMLGAGIKNSEDATFSGVLMGDVSRAQNASDETIGLYGYYHGDQSFGFRVNGTAFIGRGSAQITFDGNRGEIHGNHIYASEITNGVGFYVDPDGNMECTSAVITGAVQSGGSITGATINNGNGSFSVDENGNMVCLNADIRGGQLTIGNNFSVTPDGTMECTNAVAKNISVTEGTISVGGGNFTVNNRGEMTCTDATINGGSLTIGENFKVSRSGVLECSKAIIEGKITTNNIEVTGGTIRVGGNFEVTNEGIVTCKNIIITGGNINLNNKFTVSNEGKVGIKSGNMNIAEGDTSFDVSDKGVLTCKGAIIEGSLKVSGGGITSTDENDDTTFSVTAAGKMTCKGASISSASIYSATISKATIKKDCIVDGLLACGGLTVNNINFTPQTFAARFAFAPYDMSVLRTDTLLLNESEFDNTYTYKFESGDIDFDLTADLTSGKVSGSITLPEHKHMYYRTKYSLSKMSTNIYSRNILDDVHILASKSISFNPDS